jgi:hypothetical protein
MDMNGMMMSNPYTAAIAQAGQAAMGALQRGEATGGTNSASGLFDHSGWSVNFGSGSSSATQNRTTQAPVSAQVSSLLNNPMALLLIGVGVYLLAKHGK